SVAAAQAARAAGRARPRRRAGRPRRAGAVDAADGEHRATPPADRRAAAGDLHGRHGDPLDRGPHGTRADGRGVRVGRAARGGRRDGRAGPAGALRLFQPAGRARAGACAGRLGSRLGPGFSAARTRAARAPDPVGALRLLRYDESLRPGSSPAAAAGTKGARDGLGSAERAVLPLELLRQHPPRVLRVTALSVQAGPGRVVRLAEGLRTGGADRRHAAALLRSRTLTGYGA